MATSFDSSGSSDNTPMNAKKRLHVVDALDVDAELAKFEAEERKRLGLDDTTEHWVEKMADLSFTKKEKANITMLVGGLTMAHDYFVEAGIRGNGYNVEMLDLSGIQNFEEAARDHALRSASNTFGLTATTPQFPSAVAVAKARAGSTATLAVQEGVQMHGGMGMTDQFDVGFFMKRARVCQELLGDSNFHADQLARMRGY